MATHSTNTIVLIHGFWVTPRSWEQWKSRYEGRGFTVHTQEIPLIEQHNANDATLIALYRGDIGFGEALRQMAVAS